MGTKLIKHGGLRGSKQEAEVDGMNTVPNAMETHKAKLLQILEDALGIEAIETAFCGMIVHNENDEDKDVKEIFQQVFKPFWAAVPVDAREQLLLDFVSFIYNENNPRRIDLAFGLLGSLVETSLLPSRLLCDAILKTPHLSFHKEAMWCKTFQLLLRIIGGVDYKGCRDILSLVFQRFQNIPSSSDAVYTARIEACVKDRGVTRNYGYNVRGQIATGRYVNPRSPRVTSISAVSYDGLIATHMTRKTLNGRRFKRFLRNEIAPQLQPYNGVNDRSVVVMDNHAAHHVAGVEEIVEPTGALLLYLPPYCPELNPIEGVFSMVKGWLQANDLMFLITPDPQEMILRGFFHVTRSDVQSLYTHCGYS